jgi:AcrR family transcriptional regulator
VPKNNGSEAPTGTAARSTLSRQAILDAARQLFAAQGYTATSISDIVARAGTSVGLPYYHFGSKKKIFLTLWQEFQASQETRSRAAIGAAQKSGATGKDLLLAGTRAYLQGAWEAREIMPLVISRDVPGLDSVMAQMDRKWEKQSLGLLAEYDPIMARTAIVVLTGALRAVCMQFPKLKNDAEAVRFIDEALFLCSGLLAGLDSS